MRHLTIFFLVAVTLIIAKPDTASADFLYNYEAFAIHDETKQCGTYFSPPYELGTFQGAIGANGWTIYKYEPVVDSADWRDYSVQTPYGQCTFNAQGFEKLVPEVAACCQRLGLTPSAIPAEAVTLKLSTPAPQPPISQRTTFFLIGGLALLIGLLTFISLKVRKRLHP